MHVKFCTDDGSIRIRLDDAGPMVIRYAFLPGKGENVVVELIPTDGSSWSKVQTGLVTGGRSKQPGVSYTNSLIFLINVLTRLDMILIYRITNYWLMGIKEITVKNCICERCMHEWVTRGKDMPKVCPKCKSPYWNVPKKHSN